MVTQGFAVVVTCQLVKSSIRIRSSADKNRAPIVRKASSSRGENPHGQIFVRDRCCTSPNTGITATLVLTVLVAVINAPAQSTP